MPATAKVIIEPATEADLDELSELVGELFAQESDFRPNKEKQLRGLRLIFEQPNRGRVFVLLEDLVIHKQYQGHGYGSDLLKHAIEFARQKNFLRITLLTDRPENVAQEFFRRHGFHESSMIPMRLLLTPETGGSETSLQA